MSWHPIGNIFISQLKILLDQVEEAVGDFDECIKLRPDSALAKAQKCFALVSTTGRSHLYAGTVLEAVWMRWYLCLMYVVYYYWLSTRRTWYEKIYILLILKIWMLLAFFSYSTGRPTLETTHPRFRKPWMVLRTSLGGFQSVLRAMLSMHRYCSPWLHKIIKLCFIVVYYFIVLYLTMIYCLLFSCLFFWW